MPTFNKRLLLYFTILTFFHLSLVYTAWSGEPGITTDVAKGEKQPEIPEPKVPYYSIPSKAELCGEPVPLQKRDVRERFEREFLLSVYNRAQVYLWLKREGRYFPHIEKKLKEKGLPDDLKYLAVAESDLMDYAYSPRGAAGHWQFIRSTGRRYGLQINRKKDERLDFYKATDAAFSYLSELYEEFGSWALAMAAYNCGEIRVRKEIKEQDTKNYYMMNLPTETERYIFRILAIKLILSNPKKYGYYLPEHEKYKEIAFEHIWIRSSYPVHMKIIAKACNTCFKEIKELNPSYKGYYIPSGRHEISIPAGCSRFFADTFSRLAEIEKKRTHDLESLRKKSKRASRNNKRRKVRYYVVKKGDTLTGIARTFGVSIRKIRKWNSLSRNTIIPGQNIKICE